MAVQDGPTAITVSWSPPIPLGDTTGYSISYTGISSGSGKVSNGSTDNYLLTGLQDGATYTISVVATSLDLPSDAIEIKVMLGETSLVNNPPSYIKIYNDFSVSVPGQPSVNVTSIRATSITLSWSVPGDSVVTSYEVMWQEVNSSTEMISGSLNVTSYTIEDLLSTTPYTIITTAYNAAGSNESLPIIITTGNACSVLNI